MMSFCMGHIHFPLFANIYLIDATIITEALFLTVIIFMGLTYFAFISDNYNVFAMYSILYSLLSNLVWLIIINIFIFDNTFFEMLTVYFSVTLFAVYVVVDTQHLLMDNHRSAVEHATSLFLDFVNLFIDVVRILMDVRDKRGRD